MILGSGDLAMALAAIGQYDEVIRAFDMNRRQAQHYRRWARRWHQSVSGSLGVVEGDLYHLWHGALEDRGYERRYVGLARFDFDPFTDIALDGQGCWRWSSDKPRMHRSVREYFALRMEDGRAG